MELITRIARRVIRLTMSRPERIEFEARALIQKLAREEAAIRSVRIARLQGTFWELERLERTARNARLFRDLSQTSLRRELGLAEFPTAIEIADWGVPPTPPVKGRSVPLVGEVGQREDPTFAPYGFDEDGPRHSDACANGYPGICHTCLGKPLERSPI